MTIFPGASAGAARPRGFGCSRFSRDEDAAVALLDLSSSRAGSGPAPAPPRRCADRSRRDARDSARCRRPRGRRRAGRDNGCNARRRRTLRRRCARAAPPRRRHGRASLPPPKVCERDPLGQVRAARRRLFLRHRTVPPFTQSCHAVMPRNCWRSCGLSRKHAEHAARHHGDAGLVHAARGHALMRSPR